MDALILLADNKFKTFCQAKPECPISQGRKDPCSGNPNPETVQGEKEAKAARGNQGGQRQDQKGQKKKKKKDGPKWMQVPPADANKGKPETIKGKQYFWCAKHAKWQDTSHLHAKARDSRIPKPTSRSPHDHHRPQPALGLPGPYLPLSHQTANDCSTQGLSYHLG